MDIDQFLKPILILEKVKHEPHGHTKGGIKSQE
jgi:hypothetical protein